MIVPLHHDQLVGRHVLLRDVPRRTITRLAPADADALALADRVEHQPDVLADDGSLGRAHKSGLARQITIEELSKRPLADETDAGRVLLRVHRQVGGLGKFAHPGLGELAQRKQHARELLLIEPVQEVALILGAVARLEQLEARARLTHTRIVTGGDALGAELHRVIEKRLELDLGVAQYVGVGRAPGRVLAQEFAEHPVLVFGCEVDDLELDAEQIGNRSDVDEVCARRAVLVVIVVFPVLHEQADYFESLLLQQQRGDRRIDPARHADDDSFGHALNLSGRCGG